MKEGNKLQDYGTEHDSIIFLNQRLSGGSPSKDPTSLKDVVKGRIDSHKNSYQLLYTPGLYIVEETNQGQLSQ